MSFEVIPMASALATGSPLAPRGVGIEGVEFLSAECSSFRQRARRILRHSSNPGRCMELMRMKARDVLELNFVKIKKESEFKDGVEEPVCQGNLPLSDEVRQKGNLEQGVDYATLCLPTGHVEDEAMENGGLGLLMQSQGTTAAVKEGHEDATGRGHMVFGLQGHHGKKLDQGGGHIKNQDVKAYVLYKAPPWHILAFREMQKTNSIFQRKEDPAILQRSVCVVIFMAGKDIVFSVGKSGKKIIQEGSSRTGDSNIVKIAVEFFLGYREHLRNDQSGENMELDPDADRNLAESSSRAAAHGPNAPRAP